jgi:hypothetical protein
VLPNERRKKKILAVASAGGHWVQLCRVHPAFEGFDAVYLSAGDVAIDPNGKIPHIVCNFSRSSIFATVKGALAVMLVILQHRPQFIITTGAGVGLVAIIIGRLFGARTLWLDSIANAGRLSTSGRVARIFAHKSLTQWEHLIEGNRVLYWGRVI